MSVPTVNASLLPDTLFQVGMVGSQYPRTPLLIDPQFPTSITFTISLPSNGYLFAQPVLPLATSLPIDMDVSPPTYGLTTITYALFSPVILTISELFQNITFNVRITNGIDIVDINFGSYSVYISPRISINRTPGPSPGNALPAGMINTIYPPIGTTFQLLTGVLDHTLEAAAQPAIGLPGDLEAYTDASDLAATTTISSNGLPVQTVGLFNNIILNITVNSLQFGLFNIPFNYYSVFIDPTCITTGTEILMADGQVKNIELIQRGDVVAGDLAGSKTYTVANVLSDTINPVGSSITMVMFKKDSLGPNIPSKDLLVTRGHPIVYQNKRIWSMLFAKFPDVEIHTNIDVATIVPVDTDGKYKLWDIQFETVGSFVANGTVVQSRHPQSCITPLAKELYFNQELYSADLKDDSDPVYEYPQYTEMVDYV